MLYIVLLFLAALIAAAYLHIQQNKRFSSYWKQHADSKTAEWISQFAWARTAQFLCAIAAGLFAVLILDHLQQKETNHLLTQIQVATQAKLDVLTNANQELRDSVKQLQSFSQQSATTSRTGQVAVSAKAVSPAPQEEMTADNTLAARIETQAQPVTLQDVYDPEKSANDSQSEMDGIKKRYEGLIVNYLFLKKCGLINAQDYHTIISALAREMASVNAPGRLEHDIQTAAEGSYKEMYSQSSCNGPEIKQLQEQYTDYIKTISVEIPAH
jgi:hypothetical protein